MRVTSHLDESSVPGPPTLHGAVTRIADVEHEQLEPGIVDHMTVSNDELTDDDVKALVERYGYGEIFDQSACDSIRIKANQPSARRKSERETWAREEMRETVRQRLASAAARAANEVKYAHDPTSRRLRYREDIDEMIGNYRRRSRRGKWFNNLLQVVIIGGSAIVTILTAGSGELPDARWWAAALSGLVSATAAIIAYYKPRDHAHDQQSTADAIELERNHFDLGIGPYTGQDTEAATLLFATTVETLIAEQRQRELQMDRTTPEPKRASQPG